MKLRPEVEEAVLDAKIAVTRLGASNCHERLLALVELGVRLACAHWGDPIDDDVMRDILQAQPGAEGER